MEGWGAEENGAGGSMPVSTSMCARPLRVQGGAAMGREGDVWGQTLVLESWAPPVSRGGRGGLRTRRYPTWDEQWGGWGVGKGVMEGQGSGWSGVLIWLLGGVPRPGNRWPQCTVSEEGGWSLFGSQSGPRPSLGSAPVAWRDPTPVLGLSLCVQCVFQSRGPPFGEVFVLLWDQPGGQIIKSDPALQSCANCGISGRH